MRSSGSCPAWATRWACFFRAISVGAIPLPGDLFDAGFKANQRNIRLLGL